MVNLVFDLAPSATTFSIVGVAALMCALSFAAAAVSERMRGSKDTNLRQRLLSSCVLALLVIACTYTGGIVFALAIGIVSAGCIKEFLHLVKVEDTFAYRWIGRLSALTLSLAAFFESSLPLKTLMVSTGRVSESTLARAESYHPFYVLPILIIMIILIVPLVLQRYQGMSVRESFTIFGVLYFGWFLSHLVFLRNHAGGFGYTMFLCLAIVFNDVCAYASGRLVGKTKMAPLISPKKTREGAVGGFLGSLAAALLFRYLIAEMTVATALLVGVLLGVTAPLGDLIVSVVKRDAGVKDSADLIPGHGGLLDRCGSYIFASPAFYYTLRLTGLLN